jgi:hypothetical protein
MSMVESDTIERKVIVFLSYAREDQASVDILEDKLNREGFTPWRDTSDILPGQTWADKIKAAIRGADYVVACLSRHSVDKRGWVQRELRLALDAMEGMLHTDIYLIPVRLEECAIPDSLRDFQAVDLFESDGWERLVAALKAGLRRTPRGVEPAVPIEKYGLDMRAVDLVFLQEGSLNCILYWRNGEAFDFRRNVWEQITFAAAQARLSDNPIPLESFVCLRGDHLIDGADRALVSHLLAFTSKLAWRARRYVVKDQSIGLNAVGDKFASLSFWFDAVLRGGATDVSEIQMEDRYDLGPIRLGSLRTACDESASRYSLACGNRREIWKCHLLGSDPTLVRFLKPFVAYPSQNESGENLLVVIRACTRLLEKQVKDILGHFGGSPRQMVTWLDFGRMPPTTLDAFCTGRKLKLLHCRGAFELRYLLHRLNGGPSS